MSADFCFGLFILGVLLGLVTLVGHGIWVLAAKLLGASSPTPRGVSSTVPDDCPRCGRQLPLAATKCKTCGLELDSATAQELADLEAVHRQLQRFRQEGSLETSVLALLQGALNRRQHRLLVWQVPETAPVVAPQPLPVAPANVSPVPPPLTVEIVPYRAVEVTAASAPPREAPRRFAPPAQDDDILDAILVPAAPPAVAVPRVPVVARAARVETPPPPPPVPVPPRPPRRSWGEVLAAFMEDRNILWGELIGGLLIVGCSVALVISLWQTLEQIPYFPFLIFAGITAGLLGAGLYTLHHWKLESTSRGLLVIGTLLIPLDFLVMAGLRSERGGKSTLDLAVAGGSLLIFTFLLRAAGRVLVPGQSWLLPLAVVGAACGPLLVPEWTPGDAPALAWFLLLGAAPAACTGLAVAGLLRGNLRPAPLPELSARQLLGFLGIAVFALGLALGFLAYRSGDLVHGLQRLSPLIALAGMTPLACGLFVHQRLTDQPGAAGTRTAGTATALAGMVVMLSAVALAWPTPLSLFIVCALNFTVLTGVGLRYRLPAAHAVALPCLALGFLTACHALIGISDIGLARWLVSLDCGTALVVLVILLGSTAEVFARGGRSADASAYGIGAGVAGLLSLALVTPSGIAQPLRAALVYVLYAFGAVASNFRWRRASLTYVSCGLVFGATLWLIQAIAPNDWALGAIALAAEALLLAVIRLIGDLRGEHRLLPPFLADPLPRASFAAGGAALLFMLAIPGFPGPSLNAGTFALLAANALVLACVFDAALLTWLGSAFFFVALWHALGWNVPDRSVSGSLLLALLVHATLAALGSRISRGQAVLAEPLRQAALIASVLAAAFVALPARTEMLAFAGYATWLATFWLTVAWLERWPRVFTAFQAALSVAVIYVVTHWLEGQPWVADTYPRALLDPWSLHAYGIGLALLGLGWAGCRFLLPTAAPLRRLLDTYLPSFDEGVAAALVVGQLGLAIVGVVAVVSGETFPRFWRHAEAVQTAWQLHIFDGGAWLWLGLLALVAVVQLWQRWPGVAIVGLTLSALTVPLLATGPFIDVNAVHAALRWNLSLAFLCLWAVVWLRDLPGNNYGIRIDAAWNLPRVIRALLLAACVVPVLCMTFQIAMLAAGGIAPSPVVDSFFGRIGMLNVNLLPLALVALALVGTALRERSAVYAFGAGLVLDAALMGGYALAVVLGGRSLDGADLAAVLQLGTCAAALWALLWLASRPYVEAWRESDTAPWNRGLMTAQVGLALVGIVGSFVGILVSLAAAIPNIPPTGPGAVYPALGTWATGSGTALGWLALIATTLALAWHRRSFLTWESGDLGLAAIAFLAANAARRTESTSAGYRTLMLGTAAYAAGWALIGARRALFHNSEDSPEGVADVAVAWVRVAGSLAVGLSVKAAFWHQDQLWAAAALTLASVAGAVVAVGRRREEWAFLAGLGINLAACLVVWHVHIDAPFDGLPVYLLQAYAAASGTGALLWLLLRQRLYESLELRLSASPLLALHIVLGLAANALTLSYAAWLLFLLPGAPPAILEGIGRAGGWLALLPPLAASLWYASRAALPKRFSLVALNALAFGILLACSVTPWDTLGLWIAYHVWLVSWVATGTLLLTLGLVAVAFRLSQPMTFALEEEGAASTRWLAFLEDSLPQVQRWTTVIGSLVVVLALRGVTDPQAPYWSAGAVLAVSFLTIGMALWTGRERHVYQSGLLFVLSGWLLWLQWGPHDLAGFVAVSVLATATSAAFWTALQVALGDRLGIRAQRWAWLNYSQMATILSLAALGGFVALGLGQEFEGRRLQMGGSLTWAALLATTLAAALSLWNPWSRLGGPGLYAAGLIAIGLSFVGHDLGAVELGWAATLALGGHVALASAIAWSWPRLLGARRSLAMPDRDWPGAFVPPVQSLLAAVVVALSVWVALTFPMPRGFAGPLALVLLIPAGALLAARAVETWADFLCHATLLLGVLVVAETGWVVVGPTAPALGLHRSVVVMTALAVMTMLYAAVSGYLAPRWSAATRRLGPILGAMAMLALAAVLVQEVALYDAATRQAPLQPWAIGVVTLALGGLVAAALSFALRPGSDPFQLTERGRQRYVYAAEAILAMLFVHIRLTMPQLFGGFLAPYWTILVLLAAFAGVGASEFCRRRGLLVLAEPLERTALFLPLLPLLSFWVRPLFAIEATARWPGAYDKYALLWGLSSVLYGVVAARKHSFRWAVVAALSANFGLWCLLAHNGIAFLAHPQVWLIPVAVILLVAEQLNRDRLPPAQALGLRYVALGLLYLSSTADMFISGIGQTWWPPVVLMFLAVGGMLLGILLRVRAYLFLGAGFLGLVLFSMIWHAAVSKSQTWVWWASGIVLGMAILTLFAVFEKRRNDVLRVVEQLKQWR